MRCLRRHVRRCSAVSDRLGARLPCQTVVCAEITTCKYCVWRAAYHAAMAGGQFQACTYHLVHCGLPHSYIRSVSRC
jgi:hypothetical protein